MRIFLLGFLCLFCVLPMRAQSPAQVVLDTALWEYSRGEWEAAAGHFRQAAAQAPEWGLPRMHLGQTLCQMQDTAAALEAFQEAVKCEPQQGLFQYWLGMGYQGTGKTKKARRVWEKALELPVIEGEAWRALIYARQVPLYLEMQRYGSAMRAADSLCAATPLQAEVWLLRAEVHARTGNLAHALPDVMRFQQLRPDDVRGWQWLGRVRMARGEAFESLKAWAQATDRDSLNPAHWHGRGIAAKAAGMQQQAVSDLERAVYISQHYFPAISDLAILYAETDRPEKGMADLVQARAAGMEEDPSRLLEARILYLTGRYTDALEVLKEVEHFPRPLYLEALRERERNLNALHNENAVIAIRKRAAALEERMTRRFQRKLRR